MTARPVEAQAFRHGPHQPKTVTEHFHANAARAEGVIAKVWTYDGNVYARLAVYDQHAERLEADGNVPGNGPVALSGNLPRRKAHYISLCLPLGSTADGMRVSLQPKERVLVTGYLRDRSYAESLERVFKRLERLDRIQPGDEALLIGRSATYLMVETLIRLS